MGDIRSVVTQRSYNFLGWRNPCLGRVRIVWRFLGGVTGTAPDGRGRPGGDLGEAGSGRESAAGDAGVRGSCGVAWLGKVGAESEGDPRGSATGSGAVVGGGRREADSLGLAAARDPEVDWVVLRYKVAAAGYPSGIQGSGAGLDVAGVGSAGLWSLANGKIFSLKITCRDVMTACREV